MAAENPFSYRFNIKPKRPNKEGTMKRLAWLLLAVFLPVTWSAAQQYPTKPMRLIIPFAPGGGSDILGRIIGRKLTEQMGVQVTADNRPGASGIIGMDIVATSAPDGYTIAIISTGHVVNPSVYSKMPYDTLNDLAPITLVATTALMPTVPSSLPVKSLKELVALAKQRPGELNYASSGNASAQHLATELFKKTVGIQMTHVPYKGGAPALVDLVAGQVQVMFCSPSAMPYVKSGRLKVLAYGGAKRSSVLPQVPTIAESGYPGYEAVEWWGMYAAAKTPAAILTRLNTEIGKALGSPDVRQRLADIGFEATPTRVEEFDKFQRAEHAKWGKVARDSNIRVD
jgi:tripartite-type tricarboxylate transporter receptor subunit TctC